MQLCQVRTKVFMRAHTQALNLNADMFSGSLGARLQHLCDSVVQLEAVSEASSVVRLVPDPARFAPIGLEIRMSRL